MKDNKFQFTFFNLESYYIEILSQGYKVVTCQEYVKRKQELISEPKVLVNRIDIDLSIKKAEKLAIIFNTLGIKGSFFIRLHAPEYNPFAFENYRIIKFMIQSGHEIGYHSEIIDQAAIWNEDPKNNLLRDIKTINTMFDIQITGIASHGGMTGLNNLDFWKSNNPKDFGLLYEAYDWFDESFYVSDSEWTRWKCYNNGKLVPNDNRTLGEQAKENHKLLYALIHSDTYFENHFYE